MNDPFSSVLLDLRLTGTFFCNSEFGSPWAVEIPERDFASFHFVTTGECWLQPIRRGNRIDAVRLGEGDLILLARSPRHVFSSEKRQRGTRIEELPSHAISNTASTLRIAGREEWLVVCGGVRLESFVGTTLMNLLPEVVVLRASEASPIVAGALEAMRQESRVARPGGVTLMTRLADVVIIHAIRGVARGHRNEVRVARRAPRSPDRAGHGRHPPAT